MKIGVNILVILFTFVCFGGNNNMKIFEYSVEELKDSKLCAIIDSINVLDTNYTGYQILVYRYIYESDLEKIHLFPNHNINIELNVDSINEMDIFNLLCYSLEKEYDKKVFERMCFVEDGVAEYIVLIKNRKIVTCFISDGLMWEVQSDDKRLKHFYELYPQLLEFGN